MPDQPRSTSPWLDSVPDRPRFPKLSGQTDTDVVVVGGGITGVMAAWHLAQNGLDVVLLEKNRIASGDTAFTTGFLLRVPDTSLSRLQELYGTDFVKNIIEGAGNAQETIRRLVRKNNIECGFSDCSAYYCAYSPDDSVLKEEWKVLSETDPRASFVSGKKLSGLGLQVAEAIVFDGEAQFNPRAFIFGLLALPEAKKIRAFEESEVIDVEVDDTVTVRTVDGTVRAKKIVITSGWPIEAFRELRALFEPKITYALAARFEKKAPLPPDLFWDTFDPYFYYRRLDERTVILGGADRKVSERPKAGEPEPHERLKSFLKERIGGKFSVTNSWSGTLYESPDGLPFASEHPHYRGKVFVGACCGFGGNGLVLGTFAGSVVADIVAGRKNPYSGLLSFSRAGMEIPKPAPREMKSPEGPKTKVFIRIAGVGDVPEGQPYCAVAGGKKIAVFRSNGAYFAIDNTCTHAGGSLCDGTQDGDVVTCPLHGAKFDVRSGEVVGPPATRPVKSYKTRVKNGSIEAEVETVQAAMPSAGPAGAISPPQPSAEPSGPGLFEGARREIGYVVKASALALLFWSLQFLYHYFVSIPGQLERSIILASSFSGATLISIALMLGPLAVLLPRHNYVAHRRTFGVWGFTFIIAHATVAKLFYNLTVESFLADLNPYNNPIIFGALAFILYIPMYLTSTDWAVAKLGIKNWKTIHRVVYLAYLFSTLHYIRINPELFWNVSKALLMVATVMAYGLELAAYAKHISKRRTAGNILYGGALIAFGAILLYLAFVG